jgi:hypothetical protein
MSAESLTRLADELVDSANARRDGSVNRLYQLDRECDRSTARLVAQVTNYLQVREKLAAEIDRLGKLSAGELPAQGATPPLTATREFSLRFGPEDEWDEPTHTRSAAAAAEAPPVPPPAARPRRADEDDDDQPESWLR